MVGAWRLVACFSPNKNKKATCNPIAAKAVGFRVASLFSRWGYALRLRAVPRGDCALTHVAAACAPRLATVAAVREEVIKHDLGRVLLKLEALQAQRMAAALQVEPAVPTMSDAEQAQALAWLQSPDLLERILADFDAVGLVGEASNKLMGYLAAVSRKLSAPLAVVVQSSSAAGKNSLMDAVLAFMPEEERIQYSAMTGQSLFYMGQTQLKHKILAIAEEEGVARASYALRLLQSEGELTIASTGKDPVTGNLSGHLRDAGTADTAG